MFTVKRLLFLLTAVIMLTSLLTSCADSEEPYDPFAGLEFSDVATSPTEAEKSPEPDSELPDEFPYNLNWGGADARNSPYYKEYFSMSAEERDAFELDLKRGYMEELGLLSEFERDTIIYNFDDGTSQIHTPAGFGASFSGDYYKYSCEYDTREFLAEVIDTNVAGPCSVEVVLNTKNPITGEDRTVTRTFENADGECGIKCIARPDDGFYINGYNLSVTFLGRSSGGGGRSSASDDQFISEVQWYLNKKSRSDGTPFVNLNYEALKYENPDKKIIVWLYESMFGAVSRDAQAAVNEYLAEHGRDYLVCFTDMTADYKDPDNDYLELVKRRIAQGDRLDIISTGAEYLHSKNLTSTYHRYVLDGIYEPFGERLTVTEVGRAYLEAVPEGYLRTFDVNGDIYGVSGSDTVISRGLGYCVNRELAEKYGWDINKPVTEQLDILKAVSEGEGGCAAVMAEGTDVGRYYYPNSVAGTPRVYYDSETDSIRRITEDPQWQELPRLLSELAAAGFENEYRSVTNYRTKMKFFLWIGGSAVPYEYGEIAKKTLFDSDVEVICAYSPARVRCAERATGISASSENKDEAFDFLMLSQTDAYLSNLLSFGLEGERFEIKDGVVVRTFSTKTFANPFITYPVNGEPADYAERLRSFFETADIPETFGFAFDAEPVTEGYMKLRMTMNDVDFYTRDFDSALSELDSLLDDVGIDKVLDEMNKQYKKWKETYK